MRWRVAHASRCAIVGLVVGVVAAKPNRTETKLIFYDTNALLVVVVVEIHELGEIAEIFARGRLRGAVFPDWTSPTTIPLVVHLPNLLGSSNKDKISSVDLSISSKPFPR